MARRKPPPKRKHNARDSEQEVIRSSAMRQAVQDAERQVERAWRTHLDRLYARYPTRSAEQVAAHAAAVAELNAALGAARKAAREGLRAEWAAVDAEYAARAGCPLPAGVTRVTSSELHTLNWQAKQRTERITAVRNAYADLLRALPPAVRVAELCRLANLVEQP